MDLIAPYTYWNVSFYFSVFRVFEGDDCVYGLTVAFFRRVTEIKFR